MDQTINAGCSEKSSKGVKPKIASPLPVKGGQSENFPSMLSDVTENCEASKMSELECVTLSMRVLFHSVKEKKPVRYVKFRMPKQSKVKDALIVMKRMVTCEIERKVELSNPNAEFRLLEIFMFRITKIFDLNEKVGHIRVGQVTLRAEEIPEEEKKLGPCDHLVRVFHFMENPSYHNTICEFAHPFLFVIYEGEKLSDVKKRIKKKLEVLDEEFSKWNFSVLKVGGPKRLQDDDIVSSQFEGTAYGPWIPCLGLEHSDKLPNTWHFPIVF